MPYRTAENVIDGLVMTFIDIDQVKRRQDEAAEARRVAELIFDGLPSGVIVVDDSLRVVSANRAIYEIFRTNPKQALGEAMQTIADGVLDIAELVARVGEVFRGDLADARLSVQPQGHRIGHKDLLITVRKLTPSAEKLPLVLIVVQDLSPIEQP
jgi:two-component system CheB/CheR fusion protein